MKRRGAVLRTLRADYEQQGEIDWCRINALCVRSWRISSDHDVTVNWVDELGFVPLSKTGAELLFELVSQRYERGGPHHLESSLRRMDRDVRLGAPDRGAA